MYFYFTPSPSWLKRRISGFPISMTGSQLSHNPTERNLPPPEADQERGWANRMPFPLSLRLPSHLPRQKDRHHFASSGQPSGRIPCPYASAFTTETYLISFGSAFRISPRFLSNALQDRFQPTISWFYESICVTNHFSCRGGCHFLNSAGNGL